MLDWKLIKNKRELLCRCGEVYASHAQYDGIKAQIISKDPCPGCKKTDDVKRTLDPKPKPK